MIDCPRCKEETIWGGDIDIEDADENPRIETNYHCPSCGTDVIVIWSA